ncbi:hypothetical protein DENSPDRAFT_261490 [Dentipellis sp. KUC8613]|nr:hypothetical protein DENSPDRAFT_261490 [Dentipellis sp. KUC8613]
MMCFLLTTFSDSLFLLRIFSAFRYSSGMHHLTVSSPQSTQFPFAALCCSVVRYCTTLASSARARLPAALYAYLFSSIHDLLRLSSFFSSQPIASAWAHCIYDPSGSVAC